MAKRPSTLASQGTSVTRKGASPLNRASVDGTSLTGRTRLRRVCFTLNNYSNPEYLLLRNMPDVTAICLGKEVGHSGTPHIQGAVLFSKQKSFAQIKKLIGTRAHIERMKGTPLQAFDYCRKDGDFYEHGDLPKPGKRTDLKCTLEAVRNGSSLQELAREEDHAHVLVRNHKGLLFYQNLLNMDKPLNKKRVLWFYGSSGTNKTRTAQEIGHVGNGGTWMSSGSLQWFDGYVGQETAIFDDLRTKHTSFSMLLRLLDLYELSVPTKGSFVRWNPKVLIITAPMRPEAMWNLHNEGDIKQLTRRIDGIVEFPLHSMSLHVMGAKALLAPQPIAPPQPSIVVVPDEEPAPPLTDFSPIEDDEAAVAAEDMEKAWALGEQRAFNWDPMDDSDDLDLGGLDARFL